MEVETEVAAPDDIRSALAAAITEHEPVETPAPKSETKSEPELPLETKTETEAKTETRERDETGKFKKQEAKTEVKEAEVKEPTAETTEGKEKPEADDKNPLSPDFQKDMYKWKAADQAMFKAQSPEAQEFIMRRFKEMTADYTKKSTEIARIKTEYEPVDKLFEPHRDIMRQKGLTPAGLVESWGNVEKKLASGDQGALEVIGGLINGYKIPREKIAALIGVKQGQAATQSIATHEDVAKPAIQLPPELVNEINNLRQQVTGLTSAQQAAQNAAREAAGTKAMSEIEQFKSAVDDKGTLLRPHFEEVEQDMVDLANALIVAKKPVPPLAELYERAVWQNSTTRDQMLEAREKAQQKSRLEQEKTKSAAARKAAVSVTGAPGSGQAPSVRNTPERSLRDEIEANTAESFAA